MQNTNSDHSIGNDVYVMSKKTSYGIPDTQSIRSMVVQQSTRQSNEPRADWSPIYN